MIQENVADKFDLFGRRVVSALQQGISSRGLDASGKLRRSIYHEVTVQGSEVILQVYANSYIYTLVPPGRRPNASNSGGLKEAIKNWIKNKPSVVPADLSPKQFAFLVTRKIAREGNLMHRRGPNKYNDGKLLDEVINQELINEIQNAVISDIDEQFRTSFDAEAKNIQRP